MKRKRKVLADNRGSTLVESVCGLVILALVLVTMYSAFVVRRKSSGKAISGRKTGRPRLKPSRSRRRTRRRNSGSLCPSAATA